jgi:hypothetical protein
MVSLTYTYDDSVQLNLVQENLLELRFQYNNKHRSVSTIQKRKDWIRRIVAIVPFAIFTWYFVKANALNGIGTFPYPVLIPLIAVSIFSFLIVTYLSPYSTVWVFNSSTRQLIGTINRFFWGQSIRSFPFEVIQDIVVKQYQDNKNEYCICTYIYIVLASHKEMKLSQSGFSSDARKKAIALNHHQDIARKMRERVGLKNSIAIGENVYIPSEQEVAEKREATIQATKDLFGSIFNIKSEKALKIDELRLKIAQNSHDARSWEQLALLLIQNKESIQDGLEAYRRAETLYQEQGDTNKAKLIHAALKRIEAS